MYTLIFTQDASRDIELLKKSEERGVIKKLYILLSELQEHPYTGSGKPEQLKYEYAGRWSRRINAKHRLIYEVKEELITVEVIQAYGHYKDK